MSLSFAQLMIGLVTEQWITEAEGEAWLDGQLPAAFNALIASLPQQARFAAKARAKRPSAVLRNDALVNALAAAQGKTPEELDAFFTTYAGV
jgi:ribonuclease D